MKFIEHVEILDIKAFVDKFLAEVFGQGGDQIDISDEFCVYE